ncbi:MAG: branched-chain amino acid transaminase [Conexibacter sp.]
MQEVKSIWLDGELVPWEQATVHVATHALHYGTGVFEGIRCYDGARGPALFRLDEHLVRLRSSAALIGLPELPPHAELVRGCIDVVAANELAECYLRPLAFAGYGELGVHSTANPLRLAIVAWPWSSYLGEAKRRDGLRATISSWQRVGPNTIPHAAKATGLYLNAALPGRDARAGGYDEAILLAPDGTVADATAQNVFVVRDGVVRTPALATGILPGITRTTAIALAQAAGLPVQEGPIIRSDLLLADEVFLTSTAAEIVPVASIDAQPLAVGPVVRTIQAAYEDAVRGRGAHPEWLTPLAAG